MTVVLYTRCLDCANYIARRDYGNIVYADSLALRGSIPGRLALRLCADRESGMEARLITERGQGKGQKQCTKPVSRHAPKLKQLRSS
jgi:hypothetical protein